MFVRAVSTSAIGALEGAIDVFRDKISKRVGKNDGKSPVEDTFAQLAVAEAIMAVDEMHLIINRNFDRLLEAAKGGPELSLDERVKMRYDSAIVSQKSVAEVDKLFAYAGGSGIYSGNELLRFFLDIHASRAHTANNPEKFGRNWGSVSMGAENTDFFL